MLENILRTPSENPSVLRAGPLFRWPDSKTPLEIYEARNAVRIAASPARSDFGRDLSSGLAASTAGRKLLAYKSDKQNPELKEKAREAIETAEQARLVAAEQLTAGSLAPGRQTLTACLRLCS